MAHTGPRTMLTSLAAACLWLGSSPWCSAQAAATPAFESFDTLVTSLDAPALAERDRASRALYDLIKLAASFERSGLEAAVEDSVLSRAAQPDLSVEQRLRLVNAVRERFESGPRAALGVQFDFAAGQNRFDGVPIQRLVDNFPAKQQGVLREGDVITEINGIPIASSVTMDFLPDDGGNRAWSLLRAAIISHEPGELATMRILRGTTQFMARIPLGSYDALQNSAPLGGQILAAAWTLRLTRASAQPPAPPVLDGRVGQDVWQRNFNPPRETLALNIECDDAPAGVFEQTGSGGAVAFAQVDNLPQRVRVQRAGQFRAGMVQIPGRDAVQGQILERNALGEALLPRRPGAEAPDDRGQQIARIMNEIAGRQTLLSELNLRAQAPHLTPAQRAEIIEQAAQIQAQIQADNVELLTLIQDAGAVKGPARQP